MVWKRWMAAAVLLLTGSGVCCFAADEEAQDTPRVSENRPSRGRGGWRKQMEQLNRQLKEKFPEEYAEIEKLKETDRAEARRRTAELAQKAGLEMPVRKRRRFRSVSQEDAAALAEWRQFFAALKEKSPEEFQTVEYKLSTDPQKVMDELKVLADKHGVKMPASELPKGKPLPGIRRMELNRNRNRILISRANKILAASSPEAYAELEKLRETDPDAAREMFRKMVREAGLAPQILLREPPEVVPQVNYSDKDIEAANPSASGTGRSGNPFGNTGRRNRGGRGGFPSDF